MASNADPRQPLPSSPPASTETSGLLQHMQQASPQSSSGNDARGISQSMSAQELNYGKGSSQRDLRDSATGQPSYIRQSLPAGVGYGNAESRSDNRGTGLLPSASLSDTNASYQQAVRGDSARDSLSASAAAFPGDRRSNSTFTLSEGAHSSNSSEEAASYSINNFGSSTNHGRNSPMSSSAQRSSAAYDDVAPEVFGMPSQSSTNLMQDYSRYSSFNKNADRASYAGKSDSASDLESGHVLPYRSSFMPSEYEGGHSRPGSMSFTQGEMARAATTDALLWDSRNSEKDDYLHNPSAFEYKGRTLPVLQNGATLSADSRHFRPYSLRGIFNVLTLTALVLALVGVFAFWPVAVYISAIVDTPPLFGWNVGGINATGQVPEIPNFPSLIDSTTPQSARTRRGFNDNNEEYELVFSDEFNTDGRSFYPGDDAYWEAVDLNYWATHNYEWCDPSALTTKDGNLLITMTEEPIHGLNFKSGFLQSWNKFCFSHEAYIEMNVSLPGNAQTIGLWPGLWTMGNLGRAGFGATNDGTWPYTYDSCDVGTQPNQTNVDGVTPEDAKTSGLRDYGGELSWLPGQRLSACTCKGDDHPGPSNSVGRGAPEIDILEAQVDYHGYGTASQSVQLAPFDAGYGWNNESGVGWQAHQDNVTLNLYKGSITQEAASAVTILDDFSYDGNAYQTFGYEYKSGGSDGYITWTVGNQPTWTLNGIAFAPNEGTQVGQRLISEEPMYLMLNLFISPKFQGAPDFGRLEFPATMYVDYVRVYQPKGRVQVGCDPSDHPTADYIQRHLGAYTNPNYTTWQQAGYEWPRNSREAGGCSTERAGP